MKELDDLLERQESLYNHHFYRREKIPREQPVTVHLAPDENIETLVDGDRLLAIQVITKQEGKQDELLHVM